MSRLAKKPIPVPDKVSVKINGIEITVKGPAGEVRRQFYSDIIIVEKDKAIALTPRTETKNTMALWGTYASEIKSMLKGVVTPFTKKLIVEGIGFKSEVKGSELVFSLGFTHQVKIPIPKNISATAVKNIITITGVDKELVGRFAAEIRDLKKPEPYKGKGIHYEGEIIRRKEGKKTV
ncbi:MAG: rplF [Parcubacteria group bacterium Gr01-1014_73]|nr:MAG: rplF [Parcubacteria group bacterium Gr01-1014_73]